MGSHRSEHATEPLDMRLAGDVAQSRFAAPENCRHDGVFGRRDRWLVEKDVATDEVFCLDVIGIADVDIGA